MDVVALDSSGLPVTDLRLSDFQVFDNGKRQTVVFFQPERRKVPQPVSLGPHEDSNTIVPAPPAATVILFDLMNERFIVDASGRNDIIHALQGLPQSDGLYLYILTNTGGLFPIHPLMNPEASPEADDTHWTRQIQPLLDGVLAKIGGLRPTDDRDPSIRFQATVKALSNIAGLMAAVPGRKNLVWVTHGVPIAFADFSGTPMDMSPSVHQLGAALDQAHIALYTVQQSEQGAGADVASLTGDMLRQMSSLTGGRAYSSGAIAEAINEAVTDVHASYRIAYNPGTQPWNGRYHKIRVVSSRPGIRVTAKQGYYAFAEPAPEQQVQAILRIAESSPFDSPEISLRATVSAGDNASQPIRIHLRIDAGDVLLIPRGNHVAGSLLVAVRHDSIGPEPGFASRTNPEPSTIPVELNLTEEQRSKAMQEGISVDLTTGGDGRQVRLIVLDRNLQEYGALTIPIP